MKKASLFLLVASSIIGAQEVPDIFKSGGLQWVSSVDGPRIKSGGGVSGAYHGGWDIAMRKGTQVHSVADGMVKTCAYDDPTYGKYIVIVDAFGYEAMYAHLSETWVPRGTKVHRGQVVGLSGNTGTSSGPHLHFEVRVSPQLYFDIWTKMECLPCH